MGPDLLPEEDGGRVIHAAVHEELGVVPPVVEVRHERGAEIHVLAGNQEFQIVGREPGDTPVVEMEVVVSGAVPGRPCIPERFEDQINFGGFSGRNRNGRRCPRKASEAVGGGDLHLSRRGHRNLDLHDPRRVEIDPAVGSVETRKDTRDDRRMPDGVQHLEPRRNRRRIASPAGGDPDAGQRHPEVPTTNGDVRHRPAPGADLPEAESFRIVRFGIDHVPAVGGERRGQWQPASRHQLHRDPPFPGPAASAGSRRPHRLRASSPPGRPAHGRRRAGPETRWIPLGARSRSRPRPARSPRRERIAPWTDRRGLHLGAVAAAPPDRGAP